MVIPEVQRPSLPSLFTVTKEKWALGESPQKVFGTTPFQFKENTLFDIKRAVQKGEVCSFAEKGRGPDHKEIP